MDSSTYTEVEEIHPISDGCRDELNFTVKLIYEWMDTYLKATIENYETLYFYLFPVGSIIYHKSFPDNSFNFLICFPTIIKITHIYDSLVPYLKKSDKYQMVAKFKSRLVPCMQLMIRNKVFEILICFLPSQYCMSKKPSFDLMNPPLLLLEQMNLKSIYAFNSLRNCLLIRHYLNKSFPIYQETLFQLKKWSIFKLIYYKSTSIFLNGTALAIMLACIFKKSIPASSVMGNLYIFFRHFVELNWSKRSICINLTDFHDNMRQIVMENQDLMTPTNGIMTVLTPAMPHQNCTRNVNKFALNHIVLQFKEAFSLLERSSWKFCIDSILMQPLTLVDFISYTKSLKIFPSQLVLVSIVEELLVDDRAVFCEFEELIISKMQWECQKTAVLHYPLTVKNIIVNTGLRSRHFLMFTDNVCLDKFQFKPIVINEKEIPRGISYKVEIIQDDDFRILSLNFDNMEKIIRLIYTSVSGFDKSTEIFFLT